MHREPASNRNTLVDWNLSQNCSNSKTAVEIRISPGKYSGYSFHRPSRRHWFFIHAKKSLYNPSPLATTKLATVLHLRLVPDPCDAAKPASLPCLACRRPDHRGHMPGHRSRLPTSPRSCRSRSSAGPNLHIMMIRRARTHRHLWPRHIHSRTGRRPYQAHAPSFDRYATHDDNPALNSTHSPECCALSAQIMSAWQTATRLLRTDTQWHTCDARTTLH